MTAATVDVMPLTPVPVSRTIGVPAWRVPSRSHPGHQHTVTRAPSGALLCTCTAASFGRPCSHVRAVAELVAAEPVTIGAPMSDPSYTNIQAANAVALTGHQSPEVSWETMEVVLGSGDLGKLTARQKVEYYRSTCDSLGLNWRTMPFRFITFPQGGTQLYPQRGAADQLRRVNGITIASLVTEVRGDIFMATATARDASGREDTDIGAVSILNLRGADLANAYKKAITQAKRRVTLSICGLGFLDESEVPDVPRAALLDVDIDTGEIIGESQPVGQSATPSARELSGKPDPLVKVTAAGTTQTVAPGDPRPSKEQKAAYKAATEQAIAAGRWTAAGMTWLIKGLYSKGHSAELTGEQTDVIRLAITDWTEAELRQMVTDLFGFDWAHAVLTAGQHRQMLEILHGAVGVAFDSEGHYGMVPEPGGE